MKSGRNKSSASFYGDFFQKQKTYLNKKKIFKIITYIYYYEKDENKFKNPEKKYYLIKYQWMQKLKNFVSYQEISKILEPLRGVKEKISYNNLPNYIEKILEVLMDKKIKIKDEEEFKELSKASDFKPDEIEYEKINISPIYYIIPSELKDLFEECIFDGNLIQMEHSYSLSNKGDRILIQEKNIIIICTIDNTIKTIIKYIIIYNSNFITSEISYLEKNIENYLVDRKCQLNIYNIQTLKKGNRRNFQEIGRLNILENDESNIKDNINMKEINNYGSSNKKKEFSRNQNSNIKKEYYSARNSPKKKKMICSQVKQRINQIINII